MPVARLPVAKVREVGRMIRSNTVDVRTGGRWTRGQRLKNDAWYLVVCCMLAVADRLPASWLPHIGRMLGELAHGVCCSLRKRARTQIGRGLGSGGTRHIAHSCFQWAGENLGVSLLLRRPRTRALEWVRVPEQSRAALERALESGNGVVFVAPHLGPFELVAASIAELGFEPSVVVRESYDHRMDPLIDQHRLERGVAVIHRGEANAAIAILRWLRAGRPVGFLPDLPGRTQQASVRLLGSTAPLALGPFRIARRTGASVVVGSLAPCCSRLEHLRSRRRPRYDLDITPVPVSDDEHLLAQQVADVLSRAISRMPEQWLWMGVAFADEASRKPG